MKRYFPPAGREAANISNYTCRRFFSSYLKLFIGPLALVALATPTSAEQILEIVKGNGQVEFFSIRLAETPLERQKGLMYEKDLPSDAGMLFDFAEEKRVSMWMKNTFIPLDILFFDKKGVLFQIHYKAEPFSENTIRAKQPTRYVLEINAGVTEKLGIEIGNKLKID